MQERLGAAGAQSEAEPASPMLGMLRVGRARGPASGQLDLRSLETAWGLLRPNSHTLPGLQLVEARPVEHADADEHVPPAIVGSDEPEPLARVVELDRAPDGVVRANRLEPPGEVP